MEFRSFRKKKKKTNKQTNKKVDIFLKLFLNQSKNFDFHLYFFNMISPKSK